MPIYPQRDVGVSSHCTSKSRRRTKFCPAIKCAVYHDPAPRSRPGEIPGVNSSGGSHPPLPARASPLGPHTPSVAPRVPELNGENHLSATLHGVSAETLVEEAIATAHTQTAGAPHILPTNIITQARSQASQTFLSASLPIDSQISCKIKEKIWNEEFVDFGALLSNPGQNKYQISLQNSEAGTSASFCLEPVSRPKKIMSIEVWQQAFYIFAGVYTQKHPHEAPALMKYGQTIRDLAARGQNWRFCDYKTFAS